MSESSRPSTRVHDARRLEIQDALLVAIEALLADGATFTSLSIDTIAAAAGISRSTFYAYFNGKSELLQNLTEGVLADLLPASDSFFDVVPARTPEQLVDGLDAFVEAYRPHSPLMRAVAQTAVIDDGVRARYDGMMARATVRFAAKIAEGQAAGLVRPGLDPPQTAAWFVWMVERGIDRLLVAAEPEQVRTAYNALAEILWNALYDRS
jgi:AcrR family transcriptional regulator